MVIYRQVGLPWGNGIGKDVSDCKTSEEVMVKAGLDYTVQKCNISAQIEVDPKKVKPRPGDFVATEVINTIEHTRHMEILDPNGSPYNKIGTRKGKSYLYTDMADSYATIRTDTNLPLGLVSNKYEVVQNVEVFNFFDAVIGNGDAKWDKAGMFGHGHKIFVSAKLPDSLTVGDDTIDQYLVFGNSHDGSGSVNIMFSPIRCICTNMLNATLKSSSSYIRLKHTTNVKDKLELGANVIKTAIALGKKAKDLYDSLLTVKMGEKAIKEYFAKFVLDAGEYQMAMDKGGTTIDKLFENHYMTRTSLNISPRKNNILVNMYDYYKHGPGQEHIAGTAWGVYNAITGYYSNVFNHATPHQRMENLCYGTSNTKMIEALNMANAA